MKIIVYGIGGAMGHNVVNAAKESKDIEVVCGVDKFYSGNDIPCPVYPSCAEIKEQADCIVDFSVPQAIYDYLPFAVKNKIPCVIATTGFSEKDEEYIRDASKTIAILKSGNLSMGINLLLHLSKEAAKVVGSYADIEIVEQHHNKKKDAPSGTALLLADGIRSVLPDKVNKLGRAGMGRRAENEIGIHAVRGGTIVGKHTVMFIMNGEVVSLTHEAESKAMLAQGGLTAARFIVKKENGLFASSDMFE